MGEKLTDCFKQNRQRVQYSVVCNIEKPKWCCNYNTPRAAKCLLIGGEC